MLPSEKEEGFRNILKTCLKKFKLQKLNTKKVGTIKLL